MQATVEITFTDNTTKEYHDGDFWEHHFKYELENRNTEYLKIGCEYVRKSDIRSAKVIITKGEEEK